MIPDETPLFDPHLLEEIDWSQNTVSFSPPISPRNPGESLVLRPLCNADLNRGFFKVLGQLTKVGDVSAEDFIQKFDHVKKTGDDYVIVVVVSDECRGKQLGKLLVSVLTLLSKKLDCYKVTLECKPKNFAFYEKFGYSSSDETYMQCRFFD